MHLGFNFHELLKIDDLVVAPIADIGPRVIRVGTLPVDAVARDTIRVIAVNRGRTQERGDHALNELWKGIRECLPVLEDVARVARVVKLASSIRLSHIDGKLVPRAAWIAMPPAESKRQVGVAQANHVGGASGIRPLL